MPYKVIKESERAESRLIAPQRSHDLAILNRNKGIAKAVKIVADNFPGMIGKGRLATKLSAVDLVPQCLSALEHLIGPANQYFDPGRLSRYRSLPRGQ